MSRYILILSAICSTTAIAVSLSKMTVAHDPEPPRPQPVLSFPHAVSAVFCTGFHGANCYMCKPEPDNSTSCWSIDPTQWR